MPLDAEQRSLDNFRKTHAPRASRFLWANCKSFLYAVASRGKVSIYRQLWKDAKIVGTPHVALKLAFTFSGGYGNIAYDFSPDFSAIGYQVLSSIINARAEELKGGFVSIYHETVSVKDSSEVRVQCSNSFPREF
jgi:hypothetical protein